MAACSNWTQISLWGMQSVNQATHSEAEEEARNMEKFQAWVGGPRDAVVNPGRLLEHSRTVSFGNIRHPV